MLVLQEAVNRVGTETQRVARAHAATMAALKPIQYDPLDQHKLCWYR